MTKLLFTTNGLPVAKLIRWGLKTDCSHFVVQMDRVVFHSSIIGTHVQWLDDFKKKNKIVHEIDLDMDLIEEEEFYLRLSALSHKRYDVLAFMYFAWRCLLSLMFGAEIPTTSRFGEKDAYLCTEIASVLPDRIRPDVDFDIIKPHTLYAMILNKTWGQQNDIPTP